MHQFSERGTSDWCKPEQELNQGALSSPTALDLNNFILSFPSGPLLSPFPIITLFFYSPFPPRYPPRVPFKHLLLLFFSSSQTFSDNSKPLLPKVLKSETKIKQNVKETRPGNEDKNLSRINGKGEWTVLKERGARRGDDQSKGDSGVLKLKKEVKLN